MEHHRNCTLCEAMCGVVVKTEGDRVLAVRGDEDDPFSRGHICPKATALADIHHDPDRLTRPLRRKGGDFEEIGWNEAYDEVAGRLGEIRARHGKNAVAVYQGNPTVHNWGQMLFGQVFAQALGSRSMFSATSVDQLPKMLASLEMFGHQLLLSIPDVDRTDLFVVFGANPVVSNGSIMSAPGMKSRLEAIKARGGRVIVFDPRRTETAELADEHHFIRPSTDAFVLMGMIATLFDEGLVRLGRFEDLVSGFSTLRHLAMDFLPERTERVSGVPSAVVRRIARMLSSERRAVVYGRVGLCTQEFGGLASWLAEALNVLTAHLDREGGAMFTTPAFDVVSLFDAMGMRGHHGRRRSRVRGAPEFGGELPAACLAEEIDTPGEGRIRALVTMAGNPVLSVPNGARLERALSSLDFMASVDIYLNETTRHANVILPPTFALEHDHYDLVFAALAVRNVAKYSPSVFERAEHQRHDHEILLALSTRLARTGTMGGAGGSLLARLVGPALTPRRIGDLAIRLGPYGLRRRGGEGLTMAKIAASPHGVDLGPLEPCLPERLRTPDRKVALAPAVFVADVSRLRERLRTHESNSGSLVLIGRRQLRSNNSWCHNAPRLMRGKDRCTLLVHPTDAAARGIGAGDEVEVRSRVGAVRVPVEISDEIMPGVVSLPHGFGHGRPGVRLSIAKGMPGASINDVTDEQRIDPLSGNADFGGVPVELRRVEPAAAG